MGKISAQYVKACRRKVQKTDAHHHTIIHPVWRRAYKKLTQCDHTRTWSVVHLNKVMGKISAQNVKARRRKVWKTGGRRPGLTDGRMDGRTDGRRPDGHHHTIICPVWRRAYKKEEIWLGPITKAPTPTEKSKKQRGHTKTPPKFSITQRLRTDIRRSVGVTTATPLVWLKWFTSAKPSH